MKIDPKVPANSELQSDRVANSATNSVQGQARAASASQSRSEDTFQVSGGHAEVQRLTAQAATVPDVRAEKVAPLQAKVQNGHYKPDSQKVADALIDQQSGASAKG